MSVKNILFTVFDLNDTNYMKMPWVLFMKTLPIIAEKMPNVRFYILTDTKNCITVKKLIEKENLKVISVSKPILRYPYKGLLGTLKTLHEKLSIDTLVALSGWNLSVWKSVVNKLRINNLVLIVLTPVYKLNELSKISMDYLISYLKYGELVDLIYFIKLIFENIIMRYFLKAVGSLDKVKVIVASENSRALFQRHGFESFKISFKLKFNIAQDLTFSSQHRDIPIIAYFGPPLMARGYDMVLELARTSQDMNFVLNLREPLPLIVRKSIKHKDIRNLKIVIKFFRSTEELIDEARKYDLILLPFRFVVSDFPLVVIELLCSGRLVITTQYSHVDVVKAPNLIMLDLAQVKKPNIIKRLAEKRIKIPMNSCCLDWEFVANELIRFLA
jgi:hypothetical protein